MPIQFDPFVASQGLAAGLAGKLPEFQQAQNQKAQLDLEKKKQDDEMQIKIQESQFKDAYAAQQLLSSEDYDGIVKLGLTRLTMLQGLNADPTETQRVLQIAIAARNGDPEAIRHLKGELDSAVKVGVATGVLKAPEKEDPMILSKDQVAIDSTGKIIAQNKGTEKRETKEDALGVLRYVDDGSIVPGFEATTPSGSEAAIKTAVDVKLYNNGMIFQQFSDGSIKRIDENGEEVKGSENIAKWNETTREVGLNDPATAAANIANAKAASAQATKAYETVNTVRRTISAYDQAITAIENGAFTSPAKILNNFPTLTNAGADLDSARIALGLGVIQMTTFGALSKSELDLALESGVPKGDRGQVMARLQQRKLAQIKYANALEEAAIYLGTSGNTIASYMKMQKDNATNPNAITGGQRPNAASFDSGAQ
jgi:hypothetical protein